MSDLTINEISRKYKVKLSEATGAVTAAGVQPTSSKSGVPRYGADAQLRIASAVLAVREAELKAAKKTVKPKGSAPPHYQGLESKLRDILTTQRPDRMSFELISSAYQASTGRALLDDCVSVLETHRSARIKFRTPQNLKTQTMMAAIRGANKKLVS